MSMWLLRRSKQANLSTAKNRWRLEAEIGSVWPRQARRRAFRLWWRLTTSKLLLRWSQSRLLSAEKLASRSDSEGDLTRVFSMILLCRGPGGARGNWPVPELWGILVRIRS